MCGVSLNANPAPPGDWRRRSVNNFFRRQRTVCKPPPCGLRQGAGKAVNTEQRGLSSEPRTGQREGARHPPAPKNLAKDKKGKQRKRTGKKTKNASPNLPSNQIADPDVAHGSTVPRGATRPTIGLKKPETLSNPDKYCHPIKKSYTGTTFRRKKHGAAFRGLAFSGDCPQSSELFYLRPKVTTP